MHILLVIFYVLSVVVVSIGTLLLAYYPLAAIFELNRYRPSLYQNVTPLVSIIVPAYNEEKVIFNCVTSILASDYRNYEVLLVNDGSTDETLALMHYFDQNPRVKVIDKPNGGKASALNTGYKTSRGEVLFFVDADGIFTPSTIREMLTGFSSRKVGAVCGNDAPVNLDHFIPRLMALQTHVGTGFVRRALAQLNCLPIVSGNVGAFRRAALEKSLLDECHPIERFFQPDREPQGWPVPERIHR